jgi:hypothetical protein
MEAVIQATSQWKSPRDINAPHPPWLQESQRLSQRLGDLFHHLLGVAEQHHGVVAVEQRVSILA